MNNEIAQNLDNSKYLSAQNATHRKCLQSVKAIAFYKYFVFLSEASGLS